MGHTAFHCEELTGQTRDAASRQREFKGIFVPRWVEVGRDGDEPGTERVLRSVETSFRAKAEIDLLTVTTTMEVGIDIGPLQVYSKRTCHRSGSTTSSAWGGLAAVAKRFPWPSPSAGLGATISITSTIRKRITGDIPPTPFLTKKMDDIARRFLYKGLAGSGIRSAAKRNARSRWAFSRRSHVSSRHPRRIPPREFLSRKRAGRSGRSSAGGYG